MRLTSEFFVSALLRRVANSGGFAAVLRRGFAEAGAIFIVQLHADGTSTFLAPASQSSFGAAKPQDRLFQIVATGLDPHQVSDRIDREGRFDPDLWVVEIEGVDGRLETFIDLATAEGR